mgnify:CR=1 FL=1
MNLVNASKSLKELGLRQTKSRVLIIEILEQKRGPLSVEEIIHQMKVKRSFCDQATVYRILVVLLQKKLIQKITSPNSLLSRYEINTSDHHHFTCDDCGKIEEIVSCNVDILINKLSKQKHLLVKGHSLEFYGLCARCQN